MEKIKNPTVSIVIRTKNEERWITACLNAIFKQSFKKYEVILVDNKSTDKTVKKAKQYNVKVFEIDGYLPGKALNDGIAEAKGEYIIALSGHCIPKEKTWITNLLKNFSDDNVAGVYGRQIPMNFTCDLDKRDLYTIFGLDRRVQIKESFFHNANSMIRRSVWEKIPYNETVANIEDRVWGKDIIDEGYKIIYEPDAVVYHHHGINQMQDIKRCKNIVKIIEMLNGSAPHEDKNLKEIMREQTIIGIITVRGELEYFLGQPLIKYTLLKANESRYISKLIVSSDNTEVLEWCRNNGVDITIKRPQSLSDEHIGIEKVLQYTLSIIEEEYQIFPDAVVYLGTQSIFRPKGIIDNLITILYQTGFDSVIPGAATYKSCWITEANGVSRIDSGFVPRSEKKPIHISYQGLACVTTTDFIRRGRLLGDKVEILNILDIYSTIEIKDKKSLRLAEGIFQEWWRKNA